MLSVIWGYLNQHVVDVILTALLAVSEALGLSPKVASNSVFQLVVANLKKLKALLFPGADDVKKN